MASPIHGYELSAVLDCRKDEEPSADVNGRLYHHVRSVIKKFHRQFHAKNLLFVLSSIDVAGKVARIPTNAVIEAKYDRIDISNIATQDLEGTFQNLACLLKTPDVNKHAAIICLLPDAVNSVHRHLSSNDRFSNEAPLRKYTRKVYEYLPLPIGPDPSGFEPQVIQMLHAKSFFRDKGYFFTYWLLATNINGIANRYKMNMKAVNTIVDKWPLGHINCQKDFDRLLYSGHDGSERFVEFRYADGYEVGELCEDGKTGKGKWKGKGKEGLE